MERIFDNIYVLSSVIDHVKTTITTATTAYIPDEQEYFYDDVSYHNISCKIGHQDDLTMIISSSLLKLPKIDVEIILIKGDLNLISSVTNVRCSYE